MNFPRSARIAICCALLSLYVHRAQAQTERPRRIVEIHVDGPTLAVIKTRETASDLFGRIELQPLTLNEGETAVVIANDVLVRAYIDLRGGAPRIVVVDGATQRELARRVLPESESLETAVEAVTHVLYMVVDAFVQSRDADPSVSDTAAVNPPAAAAKNQNTNAPAAATTDATHEESAPDNSEPSLPRYSPPLVLGLDAGILFRTMSLGAQGLSPGAGLQLALRTLSEEPRWGVALQACLHASVAHSFDETRVALQPISLRLIPNVEIPVSNVVSAVTGVSFGMDTFGVDVQGVPNGGTAFDDRRVYDFTAGAQLGMRLRAAARWSLNIGAGLDLDLTPKSFVVEVNGERRALFDLPKFRPWLMLAGSFSLTESSRAQTSKL